MYQDILNFVGLLDLDTDAHTVYAWLNQDSFVFISGDNKRCKQDFWRGLCFDFRHIVSFGGLRREVGEAQGGCQRGADAL